MAQPKCRLEYLRKINFLSQKEVADVLGMSQQGYNKIENGRVKLTVDLAKRLRDLFKVTYIDELLDEAV